MYDGRSCAPVVRRQEYPRSALGPGDDTEASARATTPTSTSVTIALTVRFVKKEVFVMEDIGAALGGIAFLLVLLAASVVWIWALVDAVRVKDEDAYRAGNKMVWVVVIAVTHLVGSVLYVLFGRPRRHQAV